MKVVLQDGMKDCGVCSLLSIIRFYGGDVSKEYLRELTNTTKEGVSFYQLRYAAEKIGFECIGLSGKLEDIKVDSLPCIVHFNIRKNYQHFVVLYKINFTKKIVTIMDPAKGIKTISFAEFNLMSSNHYLFLHPVKKLPILKQKNIILKHIHILFQSHKKMILIVSLLTIESFVFNILSSFHFKYLLEYSIQIKVTQNIIIISIMIGFLYLFNCIANHFKNLLFHKWNSLFQFEISSITYQQILLLPYYYYKNRTTGEVVSRFKDLNTIIEYYSKCICILSSDFISLLVFLWIMIHYSISFTIMVNGILFFYTLFLFFFLRRKKSLFKKVKNHEDVIESYIIQGISNVDTIKGTHMEKRFIDKYRGNYQSFQESIYNYQSYLENENFIRNLLINILYLLLFGFGSYYVILNKMSLGTLIVFQTFIRYYINHYFQLLQIISTYPTFKISLNRIEELFLLETESFNNNYFYLSYSLDGDIVIKDLDYKIGTKVLFDYISFQIKAGEKVLLCGESGCGKSTFVKMLMRYIPVDYGKISISGIDINHYHLENIRSYITYVTANEFLFSDTIKNNICLYHDYPEEVFLEVCRITCVDQIIQNKERGYDTLIEENGFNFSNGERQRIILARSLMKNSSIYIFDEALGQIDIETEKIILDQIFQFLSHKIVIVISHRFYHQNKYDKVYKLEGGKIYEKEKI